VIMIAQMYSFDHSSFGKREAGKSWFTHESGLLTDVCFLLLVIHKEFISIENRIGK